MRILQVHCFYQQPGGEDTVVDAEYKLLSQHGHTVKLISKHNNAINGMSGAEKIRLAAGTTWSLSSYKTMLLELAAFKPDVVHVHNIFPLWSPSIFDACRKAGVPVVQTIHNFRFICVNALFYRDGKVCEACSGQVTPWQGVYHGCYRGSRVQSAVLAASIGINHVRNVKRERTVIALSKFARTKLIANGFSEERIHVKANFLANDYKVGAHGGAYALFAGRLSEEKGIETLVKSLQELDGRIHVKIAGDGPLQDVLANQNLKNVDVLGRISRDKLLTLMAEARCFLFPSVWYEHCPMVLLEALAVGLPIVASSIGSIGEIIEHGREGWLYPPGDYLALAKILAQVFDPGFDLSETIRNAAETYAQRYHANANYVALMKIYEAARS